MVTHFTPSCMSDCLATSRVRSYLKHPASSTGPELPRSQSWKDSLPDVSAPCSLLCSGPLKADWTSCLVCSLTALPLRTALALSEGSSHNATAPPEHFWLIPSIQCTCAGKGCGNVKQASGESPCTPGWGLYKCSLLSTSPNLSPPAKPGATWESSVLPRKVRHDVGYIS